MPFKPVDTALKIIVGPAIDDTDFKSREETLTYDQAGIEVDVILEKHDGTIVTTAVTPTTAGDYDWTHTDQGYYSLELPASGGASFNNTEEGIITVAVFCTGVLPFGSVSYDVVPTMVYNSLVKGTDKLEVDTAEISGDSTAANNAELAFDGTGYGFTNCTVPTVTTLTGHTAQTGDSFARLGAPAAASIAADLLAIDNFVDELETRLSAARAGYLDNLSAGAVALASGVDLTSIHGAALTETVNGYLAAAFVKLFDVVTPVLTSESVNQSANNNTILAHADYGNAKLVRSTTPANALDVSATGEAGLDFNNIKNAAGAHTLTNITVPTVSALTGKTGFSLLSTGADLILKNSTFALALADAVADEVLTGATHNVANSLGRRVREIGAYAINSGTAQAGNATCITLAATASAIDGTYNRNLLVLTDNTGVGQTRTIIDYDGSTKIAIIDREWRTNPDATTVYQIVADDTPLVVDQGVAQVGSTSSTIKLRAYASSINDTYLCNIVILVAGTGRGQARLVGAYDGTTKVVTLCGDNWITTPDDTSVYVMIPYGATCTSCVGDDALAQINTEMDSVLDTAIPGSPTAHSINQRIKAIDELTEGSGSGDLAAILADTDELQIDWVNGGRLDLLLDACALDATVAALNDISVADIIAGIADGSYDLQEMMRIMFAVLSGKSSGGGTSTLAFRDAGDGKNRLSETVDGDGNRTAVTRDGS